MVKGQMVILQAQAVLVEHQVHLIKLLVALVILVVLMAAVEAVNLTIVETLQAVKVKMVQ
tara:strand:- start:42 stop:221 length:180 start_codon:yes stop_codon:yes gene_type:complete